MRGASSWSLILSVVLLCGPTRQAFGQAAAIPLGLGVTASPTEINAGGTVNIVVRLKNYQGDTVAASEPLTVTLHSELSGDRAVAFAVGQSTAAADVGFQRVGVATLMAIAPKMTSGSAVVVVKAGSTTPPAAAPGAGRAAAPSGAGPLPAPAAVAAIRGGRGGGSTVSGTADPNLALEVDV